MNKNQTMGGVPGISRILVAIDFSPHASSALQWARSLADALRAKLILLHVIDHVPETRVGTPAGQAGVADRAPLYVLREQVDEHMAELKALIPDAEIVVREASPRPTIVDAAPELNCQMIVMGTHGHSGLEHLLLGSVADYVVRNSKVPVLTIHGD